MAMKNNDPEKMVRKIIDIAIQTQQLTSDVLKTTLKDFKYSEKTGKMSFTDLAKKAYGKLESVEISDDNIGNLILLEQNINHDADNMTYEDKKVLYKKSAYNWINEFVQQNSQWDENKIIQRAKDLSKFYYTNILERNITPDKLAHL